MVNAVIQSENCGSRLDQSRNDALNCQSEAIVLGDLQSRLDDCLPTDAELPAVKTEPKLVLRDRCPQTTPLTG